MLMNLFTAHGGVGSHFGLFIFRVNLTLGAFLLSATITEVLLPSSYLVYSHVFSSTCGTQISVTFTMADPLKA